MCSMFLKLIVCLDVSLRVVLLSEPHDLKHSGQLKVAQQQLITLSKKESTHWSFVVVTVPSQELTSSDRNGQKSLGIYTRKVYMPTCHPSHLSHH